jgi:acetyl-CoA synthetase
MSFPYQIKSLAHYHQVYKKSVEQPEEFWGEIASHFQWHTAPDKNVLQWNFKEPKIEWFKNAQLNITENCLDRHLQNDSDKLALIWEPNDPKDAHKTFTYKELHSKVCTFANVLKNNGILKGDRVIIYMSMVPELAIAVLACARIGAIHSVIFGGFSAQSIADRLQDANAAYIITQDGGHRGSKQIPLKNVIDDALVACPFVKKVIVLLHNNMPVAMQKGRDVWWQNEIEIVVKNGNIDCAAEIMNAEDALFILYTSGSTGKPKGVVHTCGGYMVNATYTFVNVFQYQPNEIFFCTADIGWITGHSYIVYGPLCAGATTLLFEGIPTWPDAGRLWNIVDKHQVNILYTAPTAIRSLMAFGDDFLEGKNLSSLHKLGTVGEPINEEAWKWYSEKIGKNNCPIVDTWWQTETGACMISNMAGISAGKPSFATFPLPGIQPILVDEVGNVIAGSDAASGILPIETVSGNLCIKFPWPSILRTTYGDHERCKLNYFSTYENLYFTGDGCSRDTEGNYRITGRVDDVLNVSGHRIGTAEVENAINMHTGVIESAVVGYPHDVKGQGIYAFVIVSTDAIIMEENAMRLDILQTVTRIIGAIAKPEKIQFVTGLPKTRSGKIMRRILRKIAENELQNIGDITTLLDPNVVAEIVNSRV